MTASIQCICILTLIFNKHITRAYDMNGDLESSGDEVQTNTSPNPGLSAWGPDVHCKFQANSYDCNVHHKKPLQRWYYDTKLGDCKHFVYLRCISGNNNIFRSYTDCMGTCRESGPHDILDVLPENAACLLQPDEGDCQEYIPMFYFDVTQRRCLGFGFTGCGGNQNRFHVLKTCQSVCTAASAGNYISS